MDTATFVRSAYLKATGKLPTFTTGSTKWLNIIAQGNFYIDQWAIEQGVDWATLYDPAIPIGDVTDSASYDLDPSIRKISQQEDDTIRIVHTNGTSFTDYDLVSPDELRQYAYALNQSSSVCARVGNSLRFTRSFTPADPQYGGEIQVPAYLYAEHIAADNDEIPVDIPNWLVLVVAADIARNDVTRKDQYQLLIGEANEVMGKMISDNEGQINEVTNSWRPFSGYGGRSGNYNGYGYWR